MSTLTRTANSSSSPSFDKVSLYLRVAHSLRNRISQGDWGPQEQLPTIPELAKEYGVALITIRLALQELASEGLVSSTRGRGTFVSAHVRPVAQSPGLRAAINDRLEMPENGSIKVLSRTFSKDLPNHFVPAGAEKYPEYAVLEKVHALDGEPFSYIRVMVARPLYEKFPKGADQKFKVLKLILDQGRMKLRRSYLQIVVVYADDQLANLLQCAPLSALVRIRTSRVDTRNRIVLCSDSYYRADKFIYEVAEEGIDLGHTSGLALPATIPSKSSRTR